MRAPRFFVSGVLDVGDVRTLDGSDARKILTVLRMHSGDIVELSDSAARTYRARLDVSDGGVRARIENESARDDDAVHLPRITIAQGIPKGAKMDYVVEKLTELGAVEIVPLLSERNVADASAAKLERWRRLARSAAQQCGRSDIPAIGEPIVFSKLLERAASFDRFILAWELSAPQPLRERLPALLEGAKAVLIAIGPEGGFSHDEAERAEARGATLLSLGRRILRTETAALALVATISYLVET
jgi:16S rRNA (uracil1498-N3)-methyltransferase